MRGNDASVVLYVRRLNQRRPLLPQLSYEDLRMLQRKQQTDDVT